MIRHTVLLRCPETLSQSEIGALMAELAALQDHVPGILDFAHGPNVSVEPDVMHGFSYAFWFDFVDAKARDIYLDDPKHKAVGAKLVAAVEDGLKGLIVLDMEI